jgi:AAA+ ATPase superfamily predicted ATPase
MKNLIGRENEIQILTDALQSNQAELIAVYGRRRVGKTYLIRQFYADRILFEFTGMKESSLATQLENFVLSISTALNLETEIAPPNNWLQAFHILIRLLEKRLSSKKQVIFLDEFPWIDTPRSNFLAAFDHFWNSWASKQNNLVIVICGSAASWMIQNIVSNKGGLHNRLTRRIRLLPFSLYETKVFLQHHKVQLDHYQLLQLYMTTGGIPHYLKEVKIGESATQAIDRLCFTNDGILRDEFKNLYIALFDKADRHINIVKALANKRSGMNRNEIMETCHLSSGGSVTKVLDELLESGFILNYIPFNKNTKDTIYKLSDEYSIFYLKFIENSKATGAGTWQTKSTGASYKSWSSLAFENICLKHIPLIKKKLGISGIYTEQSVWRFSPKDKSDGTQIDLLIDRQDNCINLCEIKFSIHPFVVSKKYSETLNAKKMIFLEQNTSKKSVFITLISTFGAKINEHFVSTVQNQVTMEALFEKND